jgi:hypothetical protein
VPDTCLITRGPSPDDERATLVTITDAGRALLGRVMPGHLQVTRLLLDHLSDQDLDHLREIMTRVRDHMRAQPPAPPPPANAAPPPPRVTVPPASMPTRPR